VVASTTYAFGTFCNSTTGAIITDLVVEDYQFLDIPITSVLSSLGRQSIVGGIMGYSRGGASAILNCHASGVINGQTASSYTSYTCCGGIIGISMHAITIYRCSATLDMTFTKYTANGMISGGIIGNTYQGSTAAYSAYLYDVVAETTATITSKNNYIGSIVGISHAKTFKIENAVCKIETTCNASANSATGLGWHDTASGTSTKFYNIYNSSFYGASNATKLPNYFSASANYLTASNSQLSNLNIVKPASLSYATITSGYHTTINNSSPAQPTLHETNDDIYDKAKQDVDDSILPSKIWDKSKIGGYTPADTPVRNFLTANVTFKNLLSGGGEEGVGIATAEYRAGDALPSPSGSYLKSNHTFRGWTTDKTGKSAPVTELPTGVFGDVTYYAVWGLTDSYVASQIKT
ncbi:MAG: InlB B-repeat-containing protein, partial [Clostridia bacterium]|nr:InlB B-repeat-containing protein [Clostridia bacterium]